MNVSLTGLGAAVLIIEMILKYFGVELGDGVVAGTLDKAITVIATITMALGQARRPEVSWFIFK